MPVKSSKPYRSSNDHIHLFTAHVLPRVDEVSIKCNECGNGVTYMFIGEESIPHIVAGVEELIRQYGVQGDYDRDTLILELNERRQAQDRALTADLAMRYMRVTLEHVRLVSEYLSRAQRNLSERATRHDASKFMEPEFTPYALSLPTFERAEYGTPAYDACVQSIKPAIHHHFQMNSHHPEHYEDGIDGMSLFDVLEMLCDWMAACQRGNEGQTAHLRLDLQVQRFNISPQLYHVLWNTVQLIDKRFQPTAADVLSIEEP